MDIKAIANFEKFHGFKLMNDKLSGHADACDEIVVQRLLNLMFWKNPNIVLNGDKGKKSDGLSQNDSEFYPKKSVSSPLKSRDLSLTTDSLIRKSDEFISTENAIDYPPISGASSGNQSVIMSLFNWSNTKQQSISLLSASQEKDDVIQSTEPNILIDKDIDHSVSSASSEIQQSEDILSIEDFRSKNNPSPVELLLSRNNSLNNLYLSKLDSNETLPKTKENSNSSQKSRESPVNHDSDISSDAKICIPQLLEVLISILQFCVSSDQVVNTLSPIESSISLHKLEIKKVHFSNDQKEPNRYIQDINNKQINSQSLLNAESIFAQKDWLLWLCDISVIFRRRLLNTDEADTVGTNSYSETESLGGYDSSVNDQDGANESEEITSFTGDLSKSRLVMGDYAVNKSINSYASSGSSTGTSNKMHTWQENQISIYTTPIFRLINTLLIQDMEQKPSSNRKWTEIFKLSLPETYDVQEAILIDILESLELFPSEHNYDVEKSMNFLRNIGALFEQVLEKANISLYLCCKVVRSLHALTYRCPPEIRALIKDTVLPDLRRQYVIRCLLENSQDFYTKVLSVAELGPSLQGYLMSSESKVLSNQNVLMIILGLLIEGFEDLEFLFGVVSPDSFFSNSDTQSKSHFDNNQNSIHEKIFFSIDIISSIIDIIQTCINSSSDCRKLALKILQELPGDPNQFVRSILFKSVANTHDSNQSSTIQTLSTTNSEGKSNAIRNTSSNSWWSGWSSTHHDNNVATQVNTEIYNKDVEVSNTIQVTSILEFIKWFFDIEQRFVYSHSLFFKMIYQFV